jgi:hypothetical protein
VPIPYIYPYFFHILFTNIWVKENKPITKHLRAQKGGVRWFFFFGHGVLKEVVAHL